MKMLENGLRTNIMCTMHMDSFEINKKVIKLNI